MTPPDLPGRVRSILDCVVAGLPRPACVVTPTAGAPAVDWCCDGDGGCQGQLTGHVTALFDVDPATGVRTRPRRVPCRPGTIAAQVQVVLARCVPTVDSQGNPPDPADLAAAAAVWDADLAALWQALACCRTVDVVQGVNVAGQPGGGCVVATADVYTFLERS